MYKSVKPTFIFCMANERRSGFMKKKLVSILVAAAMVAGSLAGCGGAGGSSEGTSGQTAESKGDSASSGENGEQVTLSFYSWWADAEQQMGNALIEAFEKEHPNIKVEPTYIAESDYLSKLNTLVAADSMPDVYYLNEYLVTDWGESGVSADIAPLFDELGVKTGDIWIDTALHKSGDHLYGINYGSTTITFYYNKEMFKEAGITPPSDDATDPWTWEEYVDAAVKLTKDINGKTPVDDGFDYDSCTQFGTTMTSSWIYWLPVLYAAGTSIADDAGEKLEITSKTAKDALQAIADLSQVHKCAPSVGVTDSVFSDTSAMLMNGQLGMFIGGTFLLGNFTAENYDVGIAQIPTMNGAKPSNMVWSAAYAMSAKSKHPKEAAEFLEFMADFDNSVKVSKDTGLGLGALPSTVKTLDESTQEYADWCAVYDPTMAAISSGILSDASRVGENVTLKNFSVIMNECLVPALDEVWLGEKTADEALTAIEDSLAGELKGSW